MGEKLFFFCFTGFCLVAGRPWTKNNFFEGKDKMPFEKANTQVCMPLIRISLKVFG